MQEQWQSLLSCLSVLVLLCCCFVEQVNVCLVQALSEVPTGTVSHASRRHCYLF